MILLFIGPSSSGKDTFLKQTLERFSLRPITLSTTRPMRSGEVNGVNYYFISAEEMNQLEKENKLIERRDYETEKGIWSYATSIHNINKDEIYVASNTWEGYKKYINYFGKENVVPIYFQVDDTIRYQRAIEREKKEENPNFKEVERRYAADLIDFNPSFLEKYKPIVIDNNHSKEETQNLLDKVIADILQKRLELLKGKKAFRTIYQNMKNKSASLLKDLASLQRAYSCESNLKHWFSRRFQEKKETSIDKILRERNDLSDIATNIDIISKRYHDLENNIFEQLNTSPLLEKTQYQYFEQIYWKLQTLLEQVLQTEKCPTYEIMEEKVSTQGIKLSLLISEVNNFFVNLTPVKICLTDTERKEILSSYETYQEISKFYGKYEIIATCLTKKLGYDTYRKWMLAYILWKRTSKEGKMPKIYQRREIQNLGYPLIREKKETR